MNYKENDCKVCLRVECNHSDNEDINSAKNILEYEIWFLEQITRCDERHIESFIA